MEKAMDLDDAKRRLRRRKRLERGNRSGRIRPAQALQMYKILRAIADRSVADPALAAEAIVRTIDPESLLGDVSQPIYVVRRRGTEPVEVGSHRVFRGIQNLDSDAHLLKNAEIIADRIKVDKGFLDFIYPKSRFAPHAARHTWEREIRIASAIERIVRLFFQKFELGPLSGLIDLKAADEAFSKLNAPEGTLLLTFHGGFVKFSQKLFVSRLEATQASRETSIVRAYSDARGNLFESLRVLQRGGVTLMAPDGPVGKQSLSLHVLGKTFPMGEGAAFLAYTSNCNTAWYVTARQGDRFVPVVEFGPKRQPDESFEEFRTRLHRFYAEKIEEVATGDPRNIIFSRRWQLALSDVPPTERPRRKRRS